MSTFRWPGALALVVLGGACGPSQPAATVPPMTHSGPIALSPDGARLYVVHPDADTVTIVDAASGVIVGSPILLAATMPAVVGGDYIASVAPRALALDPTGQTLFVTGQRSGTVYALDAGSGAMIARAEVCAEPVGILVDAAGENVFVACSQDDTLAELAAKDLSRVASVPTPHKPWGLAWAPDGHTLLSTHLLGWGGCCERASRVVRGDVTGDQRVLHGAPRVREDLDDRRRSCGS